MARSAFVLGLEFLKVFKPAAAKTWEYLKVEAIPPATGFFFQGPPMRGIETAVSKAVDGFILSFQKSIAAIDAAAEKKKKEAEDDAKAKLELKKQEALKKQAAEQKEAEDKRVAEASAKKKKDEEIAKKQQEEAKKKDEEAKKKKEDAKKGDTKKEGTKKGDTKKKK